MRAMTCAAVLGLMLACAGCEESSETSTAPESGAEVPTRPKSQDEAQTVPEAADGSGVVRIDRTEASQPSRLNHIAVGHYILVSPSLAAADSFIHWQPDRWPPEDHGGVLVDQVLSWGVRIINRRDARRSIRVRLTIYDMKRDDLLTDEVSRSLGPQQSTELDRNWSIPGRIWQKSVGLRMEILPSD